MMEKCSRGKGKKWTVEEDQLVLNKYHKIPNSELSLLLNRTIDAIQQRGIKLGFAPSAKRVKIEPGFKFAKLTAIEFSYKKKGYSYWKFKCDCGKESISRASDVAAGRVCSCGCLAAERYKELYGLPPGHAIKKELYGTYIRNAKIRNHSFELTENHFYDLIQQNCFICGCAPNQKGRITRAANTGNFVYNGVDRYDNTKGYTIENSKPCCGTCNTAKNNLNVEEFESWLKRLVNHNYDKIKS